MRIVCYGHPAPQGSKNFMGVTKLGRGIIRESSDKVTPWRADVMTGCRYALEAAGFPPPLDGPLVARIIFSLLRPRSHYRSGKFSHLLRDDMPSAPFLPPDLSKLARSTEDALQAAGVIRDDARIVEYSRLAKVYVNEDPEALDRQGAVITIDGRATVEVTVGRSPLLRRVA